MYNEVDYKYVLFLLHSVDCWAVVIMCTAHFNGKCAVLHPHSLALFFEFVCFSEEITTVHLTVNCFVFVKETPTYTVRCATEF